jgi:hypothetical protein
MADHVVAETNERLTRIATPPSNEGRLADKNLGRTRSAIGGRGVLRLGSSQQLVRGCPDGQRRGWVPAVPFEGSALPLAPIGEDGLVTV